MIAGNIVAHKGNIKSRKVKTGCGTCRIRKVKCDEHKPFCQRCVSTGRACDGYKTAFKPFVSPFIGNTHSGGIESSLSVRRTRFPLIDIAPQDIDLLNHCFSTKTLFNVRIDFNREAIHILQASLSDPLLRHAVSSLKTLRKDLEIAGDGGTSATQRTPSYEYGMKQYNMALGGLVSNLSSPGSSELKSVILCCHVFISIEQVRKNHAAVAQHIIQGLKIMREYRARPSIIRGNELVPENHDPIPLLDVFIIKLFLAPCKFTDPPPATVGASEAVSSISSITPPQQNLETCSARMIAPDMRTSLTRIANSTLGFLEKVSQVKSAEVAFQLLSEREMLLESLRLWVVDLGLLQTKTGFQVVEPISVSFLRYFHSILTIVVLGTLVSSSNLSGQLQIENDRLQNIANVISERVRNYVTCKGAHNGPFKHSTVR